MAIVDGCLMVEDGVWGLMMVQNCLMLPVMVNHDCRWRLRLIAVKTDWQWLMLVKNDMIMFDDGLLILNDQH